MMKKLALAGVASFVAQAADAAIVTINASFTATDWAVASGTPAAPIDPVTFSWSPFIRIMIIATVGGSDHCRVVEEGFCAFVSDLTSGVPNFVLQSPTEDGSWFAKTIEGSGSNVVIPEPATWAMLIAGFGLVGVAARRTRQAAAARRAALRRGPVEAQKPGRLRPGRVMPR